MKNILFILPWLPYPLNSGGKQAIFNGIQAICKYYNVFITYYSDKPDLDINIDSLIQKIDGNITILPFYSSFSISKKKSFKTRVCNKFKHFINYIDKPIPAPTNPFKYWVEELLPRPKEFINHIIHIIQEHKIDIVQCEMLRNIALIQSIPSSVKTLFVHHELGFIRHELELKNIKENNYDGAGYLCCARNLEISQLNQFDGIITLSPIDSKKLFAAGVKTKIFDSFAIVNSKNTANRDAERFHELTFVGPDTHRPNYVGVKWFMDNCWEKLLEIDPYYHLTIIGKWTEQNIDTIQKRYVNVQFTGFVKNLDDVLVGTIMIVPITVGSGIRMKILEACTLGIPFISTTIGAEGIPVTNQKECLIADTPEEFIQAILKTKSDTLRNQLSKNAQLMVTEKYSLSALTTNRLKIYKEITEQSHA